MSVDNGPLFLGFDLSTQQLKAIIINSQLTVLHEAKADFDADLSKYGIKKGVFINASEREVYAPVAMWIEALDLVLQRLQSQGAPFERIQGISGAGQQHGSVYWSREGERVLGALKSERTLVEQMEGAFAHPYSPNWQDASTQRECDAFDEALGGPEKLAQVTGSKAHHRFTGPQIMRFQRLRPQVYEATSRITLVSSFLASLFLGKIAPLDISDVCGMNLWDIPAATWSEPLLTLCAGPLGPASLSSKLGHIHPASKPTIGPISPYFTSRYGFPSSCAIAPFTGDNPSTILALPLRPLDAMVSLGTSTTFLMSTPHYVPHPAYHFFAHPTTPGLYMFMLCYKNGALAREKIRDALPPSTTSDPWSNFNAAAVATPPLAQAKPSDPANLGLFFPLPEIVPNIRAGEWRYTCASDGSQLTELPAEEKPAPEADARLIVESQILSLRLRSKSLVHSPESASGSTNEKGGKGEDIPPQPGRIYLVGGGSLNPSIAQIIGEVLGGTEGVWKLDVGGNACALGGAYRAVWAVEGGKEGFEAFIGSRWKEEGKVEVVDKGYAGEGRKEVFKRYGDVLGAFEGMEERVLEGEGR